MTAEHLTHPSPQELHAYALGKLSGADTTEMVGHLETCADCREAVASVPPDSFVNKLQEAAPSQSDTLCGGVRPAPAALPGAPPELAGNPKYRLVRELGKGGMGVVYQAEHAIMERPRALKVMNTKVVANPEAVDRFHAEIKAVAKLDHPHIVRAFDADTAGGLHLLVMEYVEGQDLSKAVKEKGPLSVARACHYVRQAALGLQHAFEQGIFHRDIKPQNLIANAKGQVKVLDFGLARLRLPEGEDNGLTREGAVMGTPPYMAPEQARDAHSADQRSDIYSLGCTLYFLLAGRPPFVRGTLYDYAKAHIEEPPPPLDELRGDLPEGLSAVVERMLAKAPADRYQTPVEVAQALAPFTRQPGGGDAAGPAPLPGVNSPEMGTVETFNTTPGPDGPDGEGAAPPAGPAPRRRRRWALAGAGVLLLALAGGIWLLSGTLFRVKTEAGVIELRIDQPGAEVSVDGERIDVRVPGEKPIRIEASAERHTLKVTKGGFRVWAKEVTLQAGKTTSLDVKLIPAPRADADGGEGDAGWELLSGKAGWEKWYEQRPIGFRGGWDFGETELHATYKQLGKSYGPSLATRRDDWQDFVFRFEVQMKGSEAVFSFRDQPPTRKRGVRAMKDDGYGILLVDALRKRPAWDRYHAGSLFLSEELILTENLAVPSKDHWLKGEWNQVEVIARGSAISVAINGHTVIDYIDKESRYRKGHLCFTLHGQCDLLLRNMRIKEFSSPK